MKTLAAVMRAEFRRAMPFLPWIVVAQAMTYGAHTRWAMEFSAQMIALIEWLSGSLAALVAVRSLWWDAPLRPGRFLATKPMPILPLIAGKGLALSLMLVAPFGIVEAMVEWTLGIRGGFLALGILQMTLLHLVALAVLFPVVWWWRGLASAICGVVLAAAAVIVTATVIARQPGNLNPYSGTPNGLPLGLLTIFVSLCVLLMLGSLLLSLLRKWHRTRFPVFAVLAAFSFWAGLKISTRTPEPDEKLSPQLVRLSPGMLQSGNGGYELMNAFVPSLPSEPGIDSRWYFSKLKIDGRDITSPKADNTGIHGIEVASCQFREALAKKFGAGFLPNRAEPGYEYPAFTIAGNWAQASKERTFDLELFETRYRWEVVLDLPLKAGEEVRLADSSWNIIRAEELPDGRVIRDGRILRGVEVSAVISTLWIDSLWDRRKSDESENRVAFIVDPSTGQTEGLEMRGSRGFSGAQMRSYFSRATPFSDFENKPQGLDWSHDLRLVVMRPQVVGCLAHAWKSPGKVRFNYINSNGDFREIPPPPPGVEILKWVSEHPVPLREATTLEATQWFKEFLPLWASQRWSARDFEIHDDAARAAEAFVVTHLDVALVAIIQRQSVTPFIDNLIKRNLPRDVITRFPEMRTHRFIQSCFISKGWAGDLAGIARDKARSGQAEVVDSILMAVPEQIGLTEAEWLDYFRFNPSAEVYEALVDKVVSRKRIDEEVDRILYNFRIRPSSHFVSPGLALALVRGRDEGPRWLHGDFQSRLKSQDVRNLSSAGLLGSRFVLPAMELPKNPFEADGVKATWFLGIDPSRFVFDPVIRKYQLRPTP